MDNQAQETKAPSLLDQQMAALQETFGDTIVISPEDFNFRTSKGETLPEGAAADFWDKVEKDGVVIGYKRKAITLPLYRPKLAELLKLLGDGETEEAKFLLYLVEDAVYQGAYKLLAADPSLTAENFPLEQLTFAALAAVPREPKTRGIDKELLAAFCADYQQAMPAITGKTESQCKLAADCFADKLVKARQQPDALRVLQTLLDTYVAKAPNANDYSIICMYFSKKLQEYLDAGVTNLALMM